MKKVGYCAVRRGKCLQLQEWAELLCMHGLTQGHASVGAEHIARDPLGGVGNTVEELRECDC